MLQLAGKAIAILAASVPLALSAAAQETNAEGPWLPAAGEMSREEWTQQALLSLEGAAFQPPDCTPGDEMFDDVPAANIFCPFVEELARRGITEGCDDNNFCPSAPVSRGQMATFIVRSLEPAPGFLRASGSNFNPRDSSTEYSYAGAGCVQRDSAVGDSWFTYDLQLPDGAVIDLLRVYFVDSHATFDINTELWAFDGQGSTSLIAEADSQGVPGAGTADSDVFAHVVDNESESLAVVASIQGGAGNALQHCGVRLRYHVSGSPEALQALAATEQAQRPDAAEPGITVRH